MQQKIESLTWQKNYYNSKYSIRLSHWLSLQNWLFKSQNSLFKSTVQFYIYYFVCWNQLNWRHFRAFTPVIPPRLCEANDQRCVEIRRLSSSMCSTCTMRQKQFAVVVVVLKEIISFPLWKRSCRSMFRWQFHFLRCCP